MEFNLAQVHEAVAETMAGERECIVFRDRPISWARRDRSARAGWPTS